MAWHEIEGHDAIVEQFRHCLKRGRLGSTFLFVGPPGIGKAMFAVELARSLLCNESPSEQLRACGECPSCVQVAARTHPDLLMVNKPQAKSTIPLELLLGAPQRRGQEGFCYELSRRAMMGSRKVGILDDADFLNIESANALLKTLEEPPPGAVLILVSTGIERQLPTIVSRCQIIRFAGLDRVTLARLILERDTVAGAEEAEQLARASGGSMARAEALADAGLWSFRTALVDRLARPRIGAVAFASEIETFIEAAGSEAAARRERARQVLRMAIEFYTQLLRPGAVESADPAESAAASAAREAWASDVDRVVRCTDRTIEALGHIDRNANQGNWLNCWLDDVARCSLGLSVGRGRSG